MEPTEVFFSERLESGVEVVGQLMPGVQSAAIGFLIGTGARDESPPEFGISHFVEQMLFRGTRHRDARQLSDSFDSMGISHDSSAGLEMSLVNAVLVGDKTQRAVELLTDVVRFPAFPEEAIDNVRMLLLQELQQREDQPGQRVMDILRQEFFAGSPVSHDVLGTEATIKSLDRNALQRYWQDRYTANNILVSIAGAFDRDAVLDQLREVTASWPSGRGRMNVDVPAVHSTVKVLREDKTQEHIGFAIPGVPVTDPHYFAAALFSIVLGGPTTSRLFQEVREKRGLAYAVHSRFDGLEKTGLIRIYVGTSAERAHESVEVVMDELRKLQEHGITAEELEMAKIRLKSQTIMRSESSSARMVTNLRSWWFERKLRGLEELSAEIDRVTVTEVNELVERLGIASRLALVAVGPRSEDELIGGILARR